MCRISFTYIVTIATQSSVFIKKSILFTSCANISEQYLKYYAKTAISIRKGQNLKVTKILEFRLKFAFQWDNVNFICHAEHTSIRNKKCMKFTVGPT